MGKKFILPNNNRTYAIHKYCNLLGNIVMHCGINLWTVKTFFWNAFSSAYNYIWLGNSSFTLEHMYINQILELYNSNTFLIVVLLCIGLEYCSHCSDSLQAGQSGDRILVGVEIFCACAGQSWGPLNLPYNEYWVSFLGVKWQVTTHPI
jgi:hypothetical protein